MLSLADNLVRKSIWNVGGDGWAYDIGFGGLDHILGSDRDVNILVMDTEVYSNTGGQASKATPRAAVAKYAASGKSTPKKDLGAVARAYGNVYIAQIAMGANEMQTVRAFLEAEAEAWPGPSLIIAYSTCIAHGIDMTTSMNQQKQAAATGYWPLYRYRPTTTGQAFQLDARRPTVPLGGFTQPETRFSSLAGTDPQRAERLLDLAQTDINERWLRYEQLAAHDGPRGGASDAAASNGHAAGTDPA